jgi:hypothetical protein
MDFIVSSGRTIALITFSPVYLVAFSGYYICSSKFREKVSLELNRDPDAEMDEKHKCRTDAIGRPYDQNEREEWVKLQKIRLLDLSRSPSSEK